MFFYKCNFFDGVDLLGLDPAQATVVWDLISVFDALEPRARSGEFKSAADLKGLELSLYHVLHAAYPGGERKERAMASEVGKIYFDLRFRLHELWDRKCSSTESDEVEDQTDSSNETFSRFIVSLLADGKSKSQLSKEHGLNRSALSRSLSKKTLEQVLSKSSFCLGLVSGRDSRWELSEPGNVIVDRLQPLTIRELHCCALGSKIGQMLHREKSLLFVSAFEQLAKVRQQVASSMIEITGIDLGNRASLSAFEALCRQATYAVSTPDSYLFEQKMIGGNSYPSNDSKRLDQSVDSIHYEQSSPIVDWLEDFHCGKLLPRFKGTNTAYDILKKFNTTAAGQRDAIEKYLQDFLASERGETSRLIASGHWKDAWTELIDQIVDKKAIEPTASDEVTDLILRQHAMLTRGLLELQMLVAYKFYANSASEQERQDRIQRVINEMQSQVDDMKRYIDAKNSYQLANFVRADMLFHLVITNLLQRYGRQFLPANASEVEKYLSVSLLGRDELRFRSKNGRSQLTKEHEEILQATKQYLWSKARDSESTSKDTRSAKRTNELLATKEVAWALGKHLFEAIHDESSQIEIRSGSQKNIAQLQEVSLMFELMLSQGLKFDPIKLWEKGGIDRLIYLSDCFPPKEIVLSDSNASDLQNLTPEQRQVKINQMRLVLAMEKVINRSGENNSQYDIELKTLMAIFVPPKDFIDRLVSNTNLSKNEKLGERLSKAYMGSDYDCKRHVQAFKEQVEALFKELSNQDQLSDLLCDLSASERKIILGGVKPFLRKGRPGNRDSGIEKLKGVLDYIRVFDLPPEAHKQVIFEAGGTVAWHLSGSDLIYTYRQDLNGGVSRVVDTRGDRKSELFDFIYFMIEKAGATSVEELINLVLDLDSQPSSAPPDEKTKRLSKFLENWQRDLQHASSEWRKIASTILLMLLPMFQMDDSNMDVFRDTCVYNNLVTGTVFTESTVGVPVGEGDFI